MSRAATDAKATAPGRCFLAGDGEVGIPLVAVEVFLDSCEDDGLGVLGWELWLVDHALSPAGTLKPAPGQWVGSVPRHGDEGGVTIGGEVELRRDGESKQDFARRSVGVVRSQVGAFEPSEVPEAYRSALRVNFTLDLPDAGSRSRFPTELARARIVPLRRLREEDYITTWKIARLWGGLALAGSARDAAQPYRQLRLVPDQMLDEGHYGSSSTDVSDSLLGIGERLEALKDHLPEGVVGTDCRVAGGYFQGSRPWLRVPLTERFALAPDRESDRSWIEVVQRVARQVDRLWRKQPDLPFSIHPGNVFVDDGQTWLVDQGLLLLRHLVHATYSGPFTVNMVTTLQQGAFSKPSPDRPPVRQVASLWTALRTGHRALPADVRSTLSQLKDAIPSLSDVEDGVGLLQAGEREIVESVLDGDASSIDSCDQLVAELRRTSTLGTERAP